MLILTRRIGESICIGDDVEVKVLDVTRARQVRLGITAPKSTEVHREEIYERIQRERKRGQVHRPDDDDDGEISS